MSNSKITIKLYNPPATVHRLAESDKIGKFLASEWSRYLQNIHQCKKVY